LFRSVWDEYCHYRQTGDHPLLEWGFDGTISPVIHDVVTRSAPCERLLLTVAAHGLWEAEGLDGIDDPAIEREVRKSVDRKADDRSMDRFRAWNQ